MWTYGPEPTALPTQNFILPKKEDSLKKKLKKDFVHFFVKNALSLYVH